MPADILPFASPVAAVAAVSAPPVRLQTFTYDDRRAVSSALASALDRSGAWVLERTAPAVEQMRLRLEIQLRSALDLYTGLIGAGLELTRGSHMALTDLCTLARHRRNGREPFRVVEVVLEVSFLDEMEHSLLSMSGAAVA